MLFIAVATYLRVKNLVDEDAMMMLFLVGFFELVTELGILTFIFD